MPTDVLHGLDDPKTSRRYGEYGGDHSSLSADGVKSTERSLQTAPKRSISERHPTPRSTTPSTAFGAGDPKRDRAVATRKLVIERTLDLHGMTQVHAERRFHAFVKGAAIDGCRCVLVITGKGSPASASNLTRLRLGSEETSETDHSRHDLYQKRGVLRERVRQWADAPDIRPLIARLSHAKPKDGGDGAYYLFLKPRRSRTPRQ